LHWAGNLRGKKGLSAPLLVEWLGLYGCPLSLTGASSVHVLSKVAALERPKFVRIFAWCCRLPSCLILQTRYSALGSTGCINENVLPEGLVSPWHESC
jgi:hypothetical protein